MLLRYPTLYYQKYEKKLEDMFNLLHTEVQLAIRGLHKSSKTSWQSRFRWDTHTLYCGRSLRFW